MTDREVVAIVVSFVGTWVIICYLGWRLDELLQEVKLLQEDVLRLIGEE